MQYFYIHVIQEKFSFSGFFSQKKIVHKSKKHDYGRLGTFFSEKLKIVDKSPGKLNCSYGEVSHDFKLVYIVHECLPSLERLKTLHRRPGTGLLNFLNSVTELDESCQLYHSNPVVHSCFCPKQIQPLKYPYNF